MNTTLPSHRAAPRPLLGLSAGEVHVWIARLDVQRDLPRLQRWRGLVADSERQRLDRLATPALKAEYLLTRALCRETLSRYAPVAPQDWRFELNAYGKPSISAPALPRPLRFNLSNARTVVACAVTLDGEVGVDIEPWNRPDDSLPISAQVFSPSEMQALATCDPQRRGRRFYELWTLKEAYVKACGHGLSMGLDQVTLDPAATPIRATFAPALAGGAQRWQFEQFDFGPDHLLALAVAVDGPARSRLAVCEVVLNDDASGFLG